MCPCLGLPSAPDTMPLQGGPSRTLIMGAAGSRSPPLASGGWGLAGGGCRWGGHVPAVLSGPSGPGGWWWWTGWGRREEGWGMREARERGPHRDDPPARTEPEQMLPLGGAPAPQPPPTWFFWYSIGDVRAGEKNGEKEGGEREGGEEREGRERKKGGERDGRERESGGGRSERERGGEVRRRV